MKLALVVSIAAGKHRIPFRTPKLSPPAAMVLHLEVWESSSMQPPLLRSSGETQGTFFFAQKGFLMPDVIQNSLASLRSEIDLLDDSIAALIVRRAEIGLHLGKIKRDLQLPIRNAARETEVLERAKRWGRESCVGDEGMRLIFEAIVAACREIQE